MMQTSRWSKYTAILSLVLLAVLFASARRLGGFSAKPDETTHAPDLVLINGKILTVDPKDSIAETVAISGGKIIAVGSNAEIQQRAAKGTRVIDLHGRTAIPGLIDSHGHFAEGGVNELYHLDLGGATGIDDVLRRIRERAATRTTNVGR
jgi:predicted amidohydrolase YtcJ